MTKSYIENFVDSLNEKERCLLSQEEAILDATELIWKLMEEKKISRTELAGKMGKRKSTISRLLSGERNLTIKKFAEILYHLSEKVVFETLTEFENLKNKQVTIILDVPNTSWPKHQRPYKSREENQLSSYKMKIGA